MPVWIVFRERVVPNVAVQIEALRIIKNSIRNRLGFGRPIRA
jgi:hypothetical protein